MKWKWEEGLCWKMGQGSCELTDVCPLCTGSRTEMDTLNLCLEGPTGRTLKKKPVFFLLLNPDLIFLTENVAYELFVWGPWHLQQGATHWAMQFLYHIFCFKFNSYLTLFLSNHKRHRGLHMLLHISKTQIHQHTANPKVTNNLCAWYSCSTLWDVLLLWFWKV